MIRPTLDTSRDGALLLHGSDRGHLQIRRPLKLRRLTQYEFRTQSKMTNFVPMASSDEIRRYSAVIVSADHLYRFETGKPWVYASAAYPSRFQIPMGDAGNISGISGAQPSFQTADGAPKILAANGRSVTQAFPGVVEITIPGASTTGKPVDTRKTGNVSRTARIAGKAGNPAMAANTPFRGAFPQSVEKGGDSLNLRKCGGRP